MAPSPLTGRLFDAAGHPMSPTWSRGRRGALYRYYVSAPLQQGKRRAPHAGALLRVPAGKLEARIAEVLERLALPATANRSAEELAGTSTTASTTSTGTGADNRFTAVQRIDLGTDRLQVTLTGHNLPDVQAQLHDGEAVLADDRDPACLCLRLPFRQRRHGGQTEVRAGSSPLRRANPTLVKALRAAHAIVPRDPTGLPRVELSPTTPWRRSLIRIAFLAPDIQRAILDGTAPPDLDLAHLLDRPIPLDWQAQRRLYLR